MFYVGHLDGMGETRRASIHGVKKQHWRDRTVAEASTNRAGIVVSGGGEHTLDALIHHVGIAVKGLQSQHRDRVQRKHSPLPTINSDACPDHTGDPSPLGDDMILGDYMQALIDDHAWVQRVLIVMAPWQSHARRDVMLLNMRCARSRGACRQHVFHDRHSASMGAVT
jgi:hypothetical protein